MSTHASMVAVAFAALGLQLTSWSEFLESRCQAKQVANISSAKAEEIVIARGFKPRGHLKTSNNKSFFFNRKIL
jgi:hypothetical protein